MTEKTRKQVIQVGVKRRKTVVKNKPVPQPVDRFQEAANIWTKTHDVKGEAAKHLRRVWRGILGSASREVSSAIVRAYASADALNRSLDTVKYGLKVPHLDVETKKWLGLVNQLLFLEVGSHFVTNSGLDDTTKRQVLDRLIATAFPTPQEKGNDSASQAVQRKIDKRTFDAIMSSYGGRVQSLRDDRDKDQQQQQQYRA